MFRPVLKTVHQLFFALLDPIYAFLSVHKWI